MTDRLDNKVDRQTAHSGIAKQHIQVTGTERSSHRPKEILRFLFLGQDTIPNGSFGIAVRGARGLSALKVKTPSYSYWGHDVGFFSCRGEGSDGDCMGGKRA